MNDLSQPAAVWLLVGAAAVLAISAVSTAAEAALSRMTRAEVAVMVTDGRPRATSVQALLADTSMTISAATLVRVLARCTATAAVAIAVWSLVDAWWVALLVTAVVVGLVDFIGLGVAPRTLGRQHAQSVVLRFAPLLTALTAVVGPIARVVVAVGNALTPGEGYRDGPFSTESELRELVDRASESDVIEARERRMIHSVFELGDTLVREVMSPRTDMITLPAATPARVALRTFLTSGLSRLPVVGEDVDDVLGVLFLKDLVRAVTDRRDARTRSSRGTGIAELVRPATFVPESQRVDSLLREMQQQSVHLAIVVDEYGGVAGLVTLEDALEEIVGEIADEYDRAEPEVVVVDAGTFRVSPRMSVDELGELFGLDLDDDEVDSVGGLLSKALAAVPAEGDEAGVAGLVLTAEKVEGNRLLAVLARLEDEDADQDDHVAAVRGPSRGRDDPDDDPRGRSLGAVRDGREQPATSGQR